MESISENKTNRSTYTDKLSRNATVLSTLYLLPAVAQAGVVHVTSPLSISIDDARAFDYQPVDWDVDGNSVADFKLEAFRDIFYTGGGGSSSFSSYGLSIPAGRLELNSNGLDGQGMVQTAGTTISGDISVLANGDTVGPTLDAAFQWGPSTNRVMMTSSSYFGFATGSLFGDGHLIGFSFLGDANQTLYGWAEVSLDEFALTMTIDQWAFEDSGASINVGQVPLPPTFLLMLSGLALGAGGVLRGRKARSELAQQSV